MFLQMNLMDYGNSLITYSTQAHCFLEKNNNQIVQKRIIALKNAIIKDPYKGIGKPESLKHELSGKWSRRIDKENRFIYAIENNKFIIYSLKGHY